MLEAVGANGAASSVSAVRATQTAASAQTTASALSSSSTTTRPLSPSTHSDPTTGVLVAEYYSSNGEVMMQIPSQATLAYMRSGLSAKEKTAEQSGALSRMAIEESGVVA